VRQLWLITLIMFREFLNFMGLLLTVAMLIAFVMWAIVESIPEKKPPGYKIAPTDEEIREIELGPF